MSASQTLAQLERQLIQLIRRWERFVANDPEVRLPPELERAAMEKALREISRQELRTAADQFRLEQLLHRFSTYNGLWLRQVREREEARARGGASGRQAAAKAANGGSPAPVSAGEGDVHALHREYLEALESSGSRAAISFERFKQAVDGQRAALEGRGAVVEGFEIAHEDGKVKVRARIRRGRSV